MAGGKWVVLLHLQLSLFLLFSPLSHPSATAVAGSDRTVIDVKGGPDSVIWVVQLSDLHFSVFHPERARDFRNLVAPALAFIKPSLVLITGDLTDGKSKDLLTMKQNEKEWIEYQNAIEYVIEKSGLDRKIFYDLRGNHDNFGVPKVGGTYDFYRKYSVNRDPKRNVNSVTLKNSAWMHLFVGFDSTMGIGLRGPTNLLGHPSDELLKELDHELSQWDLNFRKSRVTKISFGHFPLSFSTATDSGRNLKDVFLKHSLSSYICGHLHSRFGKNLKRHHILAHHFPVSTSVYQLNIHQGSTVSTYGDEDCSGGYHPPQEFWEWEMGDWRKTRAFRILAIDAGHVSFLDTDFSFGAKKTIIVPTFPVDSRFMQRISSSHDYNCNPQETSIYNSVRSLVFSEIQISTVTVKVYDSRSGSLSLVLDSTMEKQKNNVTRGDLYLTPWNWKAFADPSPDRYWLQVEAVDILGRSTFSELRPFSINGLTAKIDWTLNEFKVMGIQWDSVYMIFLWIFLPLLFSFLLIPRGLIFVSGVSYSNMILQLSCSTSSMIGFVILRLIWMSLEFCKLTTIWFATLVYLLHLTFFSWISGNLFTETGIVGHLTLKGWFVKVPDVSSTGSFEGMPDIMVIIIPHLLFVLLPSILVMSALAAEKAICQINYLSSSGKKQDDHPEKSKNKIKSGNGFIIIQLFGNRCIRTTILFACLVILWKHYTLCRILVRAYEINPLLHSPVYCFTLPLLLAYSVYITASVPIC